MRLRAASARGVAVPVVLLLIVALTVLAHGAVGLAVMQRRASGASARLLEGRLAADAALRQGLRGLQGDSLPEAHPWRPVEVGAGARGEVRWSVELERLDRELYVLAGRARSRERSPERSVARLVWGLDPVSRVAAAEAVLVHGGGVLFDRTATIDGTRFRRTEAGAETARCRPFESALDSVASRVLAEVAYRPAPYDPDGSPQVPALGLLDEEELVRRISTGTGGIVTPAPTVEGGDCVVGTGPNWGSPTDPGGPCGGRRVAVAADGDLTVAGGEGQGLLVVRGNLVMTEGAVFEGMLLVRDTVVLEGAARVRGLVRAGGPAVLGEGARLDGRACPALLALRTASALRAPLPVPGDAGLTPY